MFLVSKLKYINMVSSKKYPNFFLKATNKNLERPQLPLNNDCTRIIKTL